MYPQFISGQENVRFVTSEELVILAKKNFSFHTIVFL